MRFFRKQKIDRRRARPTSGHSLSANSYYRPVSRPIQDLHGVDKSKAKNESASNNKIKSPNKTILLKPSNITNGLIVLIFIVLLFFATTLSASPIIKIPDSSYKYHNVEEYQQSASEILNNSLLKRSKLFFRSSDFESEMLSKYPELSAVEAIVPLGGRDLTISMNISEPLAVIQNGTEKGVIDNEGVLVLKENADTHNNLYKLRFTTPQENFSLGSRLLTTDEVNLLKLLQKELKTINTENAKNGLSIKEVTFNIADGLFEVSLNEVPYFIKLSSYGDTSEQVGAIKVSIVRLHEQNQQPAKYIDGRVSGRVYVL